MCLTATIPPPPEVEMSSLLVTIDMFHVMQRQSWDPHLRAVVSYHGHHRHWHWEWGGGGGEQDTEGAGGGAAES